MFRLAITHVLLLLYGFSLLQSTNSFAYLLCSGPLELLVWWIRLWQIGYSITAYSRSSGPGIVRIMSTYRAMIGYISTINPVIGKAFVVFILINFPISGVFFEVILSQKVDQTVRILALFIIQYEIICLLGVHLVFALLSFKFRSLSKRIMATSFQKKLNLKTKIRLGLFTQTTFTKQMYGITYWKFGLISVITFAKVSVEPSSKPMLTIGVTFSLPGSTLDSSCLSIITI